MTRIACKKQVGEELVCDRNYTFSVREVCQFQTASGQTRRESDWSAAVPHKTEEGDNCATPAMSSERHHYLLKINAEKLSFRVFLV